ncbi:hypothetical protein BJX64DRAFT_287105 [Aspergillus heterothallicus]
MNTWHSDFVREGFDSHAAGFITNIDGQIELQHPMIAGAYRAAPAKEGKDKYKSPSDLLGEARTFYNTHKATLYLPYNDPTLGYVVKWLSEPGKAAELEGLSHTQTKISAVDPFTGNAAIGYAGLNVEDGMKKVFESP